MNWDRANVAHSLNHIPEQVEFSGLTLFLQIGGVYIG